MKKWLDWTLRDVMVSLGEAVNNISAGIPVEIRIKEKPKKQKEPITTVIPVEQEEIEDTPISEETPNENK